MAFSWQDYQNSLLAPDNSPQGALSPSATTGDNGSDSVSRFAQSLGSSLNAIAETGVALTSSAARIKANIDAVAGKTKNQTLAQKENENANLLNSTIPPQLQTVLVLAGIIAAGIGVVYLVRK